MCDPPAAMRVKRPAGARDAPAASAPQQTAVPAGRNAHAWSAPAAMAVNEPSGACAWPSESEPQQRTAPPVVMPHAWPPPALTAVNEAADAVGGATATARAQPRSDRRMGRRWTITARSRPAGDDDSIAQTPCRASHTLRKA